VRWRCSDPTTALAILRHLRNNNNNGAVVGELAQGRLLRHYCSSCLRLSSQIRGADPGDGW
jgi:hypothetical protein